MRAPGRKEKSERLEARMWLRTRASDKHHGDVEMAGMTMLEPATQKKPNKEKEPPLGIDETNYQPVDWKKLFLTPKYIRTFARESKSPQRPRC